MIKGQPKTEEVIPLATLKDAPAQTAFSYTQRHLGPREKIGNIKPAASTTGSGR